MAGSLFEHAPPEDDAAGRVFVRVAVERGMERRGGSASLREWDALTYLAEPTVRAGEFVTVPLGRADTPTPGIVVRVGGSELAGDVATHRLKTLLDASGATIGPDLVELGRWMSEYYVCPLGMAMSALVPAAVKAGVGRRRVTLLARADPAPELEGLSPRVREVWESVRGLDAGLFPLDSRSLADAVEASTRREINRLTRLGALVEVEGEVVAARQDGLLSASDERSTPPTPTDAQTKAIEGIGATLGGFAPHLLHGVTGSGKTEVYLRLIARVLGRGQTALVLVPEISLTPQTAARFRQRFEADGVAVLHSGLTAAQRHHEWKRASRGEARVVVGARSAVFAPLAGLGLIIVDEEHDTSYKQDQLPRYNARDVAVKRASGAECPVVLGSATPSLESWANATGRSGRYTLWSLPDRVGRASLPTVEIVDMTEALRGSARLTNPGAISGRLQRALRETLLRGEQAILLLNRRGYASYLCCPSRACGWALECDHCDARLVLHSGRRLPRGGVVRCHHCLAERVVPQRCPACGAAPVRVGTGTQRVEEQLTQEFDPREVEPACGLVEGETLLRLDSDTMRSGADYFDALERFAAGEVRVLLGTQMVAKGLDFPNVSLVGVLCADSALSLPDFRAPERAFQLTSQVAGRAGRGDKPGRVIVQAFEPDAPAIRLAAAHKFEVFANAELEARRAASLPPASRLARVVCRDRDEDKARLAATGVFDALGAGSDDGVRLLGPAPCSISRIAQHYRFEVLLFAPSARAVQSALQRVRAAGLLKSDARTAIDVDPVSLL